MRAQMAEAKKFMGEKLDATPRPAAARRPHHPAPAAIGVVTNPNSRKNRTRPGRAPGARREELERRVGARGLVRETRSVEEIAGVVEEFLARDVRYWVSDGGDGALHWLMNETRRVLASRAAAAPGGSLALPIFVPTNGGTIDFVAKKVGIRGEAEDVLDRLVRGEDQGFRYPLEEVPTFLMTGVCREGGREARFERLGFLTAVAGVGQRFFDLYYADADPGPATVLKVVGKGLGSIALNVPGAGLLPGVPRRWREYAREVLRPQRARVTVDGRPLPGEHWRALHVGAFFCDIGGVVKLFPLAGEGRLHVMAGNPSMLEVARGVPKIFTGGVIGKGVTDIAVRTIDVEALDERELLNPNIDGEPFRGLAHLTITTGPRVRIPRLCG
jgi:diacylglycerol kinase family enzyme